MVGGIKLWPFGERLSGQDPVEKYRRWLRRWLLGNWLHYAVVSTVVVALVMTLLWAILNSWRPVGPAPGKEVKGSPVKLMHSLPGWDGASLAQKPTIGFIAVAFR